MNIAVLMVGALAGAGLGLRFKVLVLVPAIVVAVVLVAGIGITHGDGGWAVAWQVVLVVVVLQMGYLVGTFAARLPAPAGRGELREQ